MSAPTNPEGYSATVLAALDQETAGLDAELDILLEVFRLGATHRGEIQACCDMTALLNHDYHPGSVSGLLALALRRLAAGEVSQ